MSILLIDDSDLVRRTLARILNSEGYSDIIQFADAQSALSWMSGENGASVELILMDNMMPGMSGIEACLHLRRDLRWRDIPIIIMTAEEDITLLEEAFAAGASDFLRKPPHRVELLARLRTQLALKHEIDSHVKKQQELLETRNELQKLVARLEILSAQDGLTGLANRRQFDQVLLSSWQQAIHENKPLTLLMADLDHFKDFNDHFGHQQGDECLRRVGSILGSLYSRNGDLVARYGGEEFAIILPETDASGAAAMGRRACRGVAGLEIAAPPGAPSRYVTLSVGGATIVPNANQRLDLLVELADQALYQAKKEGRNRSVLALPPT